MRPRIKKTSGIVIVFVIFLFASCEPYYEERGNIFGTTYQIKYQSSRLLTKKIDAELQKFSLSMNPFNPNSIISKVNRNEDVEVDDWFMAVFNKAKEVSEKSDGLFDVTASPLINLWGFGFEKSDTISQQMIDSVLMFVGHEKVRLENRKVIKDDPRITLNCSAIAKGYACDMIAGLLEREGVKNYMVWIGGEIVSKGKNPHRECWHLAISKPEDDNIGMLIEIQDTLILCGKKGMATSGNYRNYYIKDGIKYAHTINPNTGGQLDGNLLSVTVIADDCMTADAYATVLLVMGAEEACKFAENIPEIEEYYLICYDENSPYQNKVICSSGIGAMLKK